MLLVLASQAIAVVLVADLVDELEVDRLPAGEHAAVGDVVERVVVELAAVLHHVLEPVVGIPDERIDRGARLRAGRLEARWARP